MKCVYCKYVDKKFDNGRTFISKKGEFFKLSNPILSHEIKMKRDTNFDKSLKGNVTVYGCPKCGKIFLEL